MDVPLGHWITPQLKASEVPNDDEEHLKPIKALNHKALGIWGFKKNELDRWYLDTSDVGAGSSRSGAQSAQRRVSRAAAREGAAEPMEHGIEGELNALRLDGNK